MVSGYTAFPREGYLEMLHRIVVHSKKRHDTEMVFTPSKPSINNNDIEIKDCRCSEFSSAIKKERELHPRTPSERCRVYHSYKKGCGSCW